MVASTSPKAENNHAEKEQQIKPSFPSISNPSSPSVSETTPSQAEPEPEPNFDEAAVINGVINQVSS